MMKAMFGRQLQEEGERKDKPWKPLVVCCLVYYWTLPNLLNDDVFATLSSSHLQSVQTKMKPQPYANTASCVPWDGQSLYNVHHPGQMCVYYSRRGAREQLSSGNVCTSAANTCKLRTGELPSSVSWLSYLVV
jgi:hypothetical protein